jgi:hypothetical protein
VSKTLSFRDIKPSDARVMGESAMCQLVSYAAEELVHTSLISHTLHTYIHTYKMAPSDRIIKLIST